MPVLAALDTMPALNALNVSAVLANLGTIRTTRGYMAWNLTMMPGH